ncbi:MAG: hypothetical protein RMN51_11305 [Verrucomicrobiota bacterium]|nr:hypothetical protein [Limisphaera sp.]MDW8382675.1 hypothetical protein [Verrucomicrobiota bacterium]
MRLTEHLSGTALSPSVAASGGILWRWVVLAFLAVCLIAVGLYFWSFPEPRRRLAGAMVQYVGFLESGGGKPTRVLSGKFRVDEATGRWHAWQDSEVQFWFQPPDHFRLEWMRPSGTHIWIRRGNILEVHAREQRRGFRSVGASLGDGAFEPADPDFSLAPVRSPVPPGRVWMAVLTLDVEFLEPGPAFCRTLDALRIRPKSRVVRAGALPKGELRVWLRRADGLPLRVELWNWSGQRLWALLCENWQLESSASAHVWEFAVPPGHQVQGVPLPDLASYWRHWFRPTPELPDAGQTASPATVQPGPIPVIVLEGDRIERARQLGRTCGAWVRWTVGTLVDGWCLERSLQEGRWIAAEFSAGSEEGARVGPTVQTELWEALASAAGLTSWRVHAAHVLANQAVHSALRMQPDRPREAPATVSQAWHNLAGYLSGLPPAVIIHRPRQGFAWASIGPLGLWSGWLGMNNRQLALLVEEMSARGTADGEALLHLGQILEHCPNLVSALEEIRRSSWRSEAKLLLMEGQTGLAVRIHLGPRPDQVEIFWLHGNRRESASELPRVEPTASTAKRGAVGAQGDAMSGGDIDARGIGSAKALAPDSTNAWEAGLIPAWGRVWLAFAPSSGIGDSSKAQELDLRAWLGGL